MMSKDAPIGLFDSGVGGTSIWREIHERLPFENTLYLADSANAPYGAKSPDEIINLSIKNTELLLAKGCKLIVVACNTATTNAIGTLRAKYSVPFIGIEPAIKPAALNSQTKAVGILATKGTLNSALFYETANQYGASIKRIEVIGEGLVPLIEKGIVSGPEIEPLLKQYLDPMVTAGVDYIVLGCSHYPYLMPAIKGMIPEHIKVIDSGFAVARQTEAVLRERGLLRRPTTSDLSDGTTKSAQETTHLKASDEFTQYDVKQSTTTSNDESQASTSKDDVVSLEFWTNADPGPLKQLLGTSGNYINEAMPLHFEPANSTVTWAGDQSSWQNLNNHDVPQSSNRTILKILKKDF